jgi:protein-L-isoaspartate(D-aspartate) O-methyltransferase
MNMMRRFPVFWFILFLSATVVVGETREDRLKRFPILEPAQKMVEQLLLPQGGLTDAAVLDAMKRIPRHRFVPPVHQSAAYLDQALSIGYAQTISPPYIVAYMTEQIAPKPTARILEIGTGSGYQAAVLSLLADQVYTIEILEPLGKQAEGLLKQLNMDNVHVRIGDGYKGWAEAAPFDSIIVTCSPESVPQPLIDQLKEGGRMMIPVGERYQQSFYLCKKVKGKLEQERLVQTLFVPMTGEAEEKRAVQPDATKPAVVNGDFREIQKEGSPAHWHYARNVTVLKGGRNEQNVARFVRQRPAKTAEDAVFSQMLQGFAIDGRHVPILRIDYWIRGERVTALQGPVMTPSAILLFYDENRNVIDEIPLGRCTGTFDWRHISGGIRVRPETREAVLFLGLLASSGQLDIRDVEVKPEPDGR